MLVAEPERQLAAVITMSDDVGSRDDASGSVSLWTVLRSSPKAYSALAVSIFANMFAFGILEVAFTLDAILRLSVTPVEIGLFFGVIGLSMMVLSVVFGKAADVFGRKWLIVIGSIIASGSLIMFMVASSVIDLLVAGVVLSVGIAMRGPAVQALAADLTDERAYGVVMGMFGAVGNAAYVVAPIAGGILLDQTGNSYAALTMAAAVSLAGAVIASVGLPSGIVTQRPGVQPPEDGLDVGTASWTTDAPSE